MTRGLDYWWPSRRALAVIAGSLVFQCLLLTGCSGSEQAERHSPSVVKTVASELNTPWGLTFLPSGDALVSERDTARILRLRPDGTRTVLATVPEAAGSGPDHEGGLLGLALSPQFTSDHAVFVYYSAGKENRLARMNLDGDRLSAPRVLISGIPRALYHDGGRIIAGPDKMLYVATGDGKRAGLAQDIRSLAGKILRVTTEGKPAPGNPFPDSPVYSYGHRNVEGLAFDSAGRLWASEFGEDTWDELNLIRPGGNYGWPYAEGNSDAGAQRFIAPVMQWRPADASPSGIAIEGNSIYMAALRGERLWRIPIQGDHAGQPRQYLTGEYGRLRTVEVAPDGALWVTTSNRDGRGKPRAGDDRILRITGI